MSQIALLTDFGEKDWFVPVMKSVIYSIKPDATVIDVSHEISPQNAFEASFVLWNAYKYFPSKTVFCVVVDPGVGSGRSILAIETDKHFILAPDNVPLELILSDAEVKQAIEVKNLKFFLDEISNTFHGRDIFAPVAAHIANGVSLEEFGTPFSHPPVASPLIEVNEPGRYEGIVIYIDRFGNLITNLKINYRFMGSISINQYNIAGLSRTFSDVNIGELLAYVGSSGLLEIAIRNGRAQSEIGLDYNAGVIINLA